MSSPKVGERLPPALLDAELIDAEGTATRLGDWIRGPTLLVFLRHFGCVGCSLQIDALAPHLAKLDEMGVLTVLIGNGRPEHIAGFVERHRLAGRPAVIVTDPTLAAYRAAGFDRSLWATLGPRALVKELAAIGRGYLPARRQGDALQQGGALLTDENAQLAYYGRSRAATQPIEVSELVDAALGLAVARMRRAAAEVA